MLYLACKYKVSNEPCLNLICRSILHYRTIGFMLLTMKHSTELKTLTNEHVIHGLQLLDETWIHRLAWCAVNNGF